MRWLSRLFIIGLLVFSPLAGWTGVEFDGSDDYIDCGTGASCPDVVTISFWLKWNGSTGNHQHILAKRDSNSSNGMQYNFHLNYSSGTYYFGMGCYTSWWITSISPSEGEWEHVVMILRAGDGTDELWVNGVQEDTDTTATICSKTSANLHLGRGDSTYVEDLKGILTEVALWDVALTESEIKLLANSRQKGMPLQIRPDHLKLYLPLDDHPDGTTNGSFKDLSGNGNDGTGYNGVISRGEEVLSYPQEAINWQ